MQDTLITWRRHFHRFPEQGWLEICTSAFIAQQLRAFGYEVLTGTSVCAADKRMCLPDQQLLQEHFIRCQELAASVFETSLTSEDLSAARDGFTGVIGILRCGEGPVTALRFDMDALPITEPATDDHLPAREGFSSVNGGTMHACGHDGHMAIGLGTAMLLARHRSKLHGTIKLIFQPAEEGVRGAGSITANHHLDDVDYLLAGHIMASADGTCYAAPGMEGTLATRKLKAIFHGKASHAAQAPQEGKNALLAAACAVMNLQAIPRHADGSSRINVGALHADGAANIICDHAEMLLEVRGETITVQEYMEAYANRILQSAADMHGCSLSLETLGSAMTVQCSEDLTDHLRQLCTQMNIPVRTSPGLGASEDFSAMTRQVLLQNGKTCFVGLHTPTTAPLHNSAFDFDESVLSMGTALFTAAAIALSGSSSEA